MENIEHSVTYTKDYRLKVSYLKAYEFYLHAIIKYKQFIFVNFLKYFKASYEQSFLRITWKIILPLVPVSVYVILQEFGLLRSNSIMPSVLYVVIGMAFWQLFSSAITVTMNTPSKEKAVLKKVTIPLILFYISSLGEVFFDYLIRVVLIWVLLFYLKLEFSLTWLLLPIFCLPLALLGAVIGIFCSFFVIFFNDVRNIVDIFLKYGLFVCGVLFPLPGSGLFHTFFSYNPIYIYIENLRQLIVFSTFNDVEHFLYTTLGLIVALIFVLKKLYSLEPRMREYL